MTQREEILRLVTEFRRIQKTRNKDQEADKKQFAEAMKECLRALGEITSLGAVREVLVPILLNNNFLIPKR